MKLNYSPAAGFKFLGVSLLGAAICYGYVGYYARHFSHSAGLYGAAWAALVVFVVLAAFSVKIISLSLKRGPAVEFTEEGIRNYRSHWPLIRWEQISRITTMRANHVDFLVIVPGKNFPDHVRIDPDGTTSFGFPGLSPGKPEVLAWLEQHHPELLAGSHAKR